MKPLQNNEKRRLYLDPRTKLLLVLLVNVIMISGGFSGASAIARPVFAFLPLPLLALEGKARAATLYFIFVTISITSEIFLIGHTKGALNLILVIFCGIISRFVPGLVMGYYFISTTKISEMIAALERMHISEKIIIPFAVMIRFFPTVTEENGAISDAMRMRGIRLGGGNATAMLEYRVVPLLISTVKIGEELSSSALTRGLGAPNKRTNVCKIGFKALDIILIIISLGLLAAFLFY